MGFEWHNIIEGVIGAGIMGIAKILWDMRTGLKVTSALLVEVKTNELPHMHSDINETKSEVRSVRDTLIEHISKKEHGI